MKPYFSLKCKFFKHNLLMNWNIENIPKTSDAVLNDVIVLKRESAEIYGISLDSSDDAILIIQKIKITTCDFPGCVAGANKIQTTSENISLIE